MDMSIRFPNLKLEFSRVPVSFSVMGYEITVFGILIAVGMLLALAFVILHAKRQKENQNIYLEIMIPALLGGIAGGRFFYVILSWDLYSGGTLREFCDIRNGGLSFLGGLLGGSLLTALYLKLRRVSFMKVADTASMGLLIVQIIGVWGCFFNREFFGSYTDNLAAMQIPAETVSESLLTGGLKEHLVTVGDTVYIQAHPLFLYAGVWYLFLFFVLLIYMRRKKYQGEIFLRYLAGIGLGGIVTEWLRRDSLKFPGTDFPAFLPVYALLFLVCGISAVVRRVMAKRRSALSKRRREERYAAEEQRDNEPETAENAGGTPESKEETAGDAAGISGGEEETAGNAEETGENTAKIPENAEETAENAAEAPESEEETAENAERTPDSTEESADSDDAGETADSAKDPESQPEDQETEKENGPEDPVQEGSVPESEAQPQDGQADPEDTKTENE